MKPRVLHVRSGFTVGGPEVVLLAGLEELREEFEFTVASFVLPNVENTFLTETARRGFVSLPIAINNSFDSAAIPQLATAIRDADIVVAHDYRALGLSISAMKRMEKGSIARLVAVSHGWTAHTWKVRIYEWLERRWYRHSAKVVAVSKAKFQELHARGLNNEKLSLIENGVSIPALISSAERERWRTEFGVAPGDCMLITVGRLSPEKAQRNLLLALHRLIQTSKFVQSVRLFIIGDGPLRTELAAEIQNLDIKNQVTLVGWRDDTRRWYAAADLFVLPSLTEGLPMALLEAQSHGLPAIASNVGGCGDVIEENMTGILVPSGDVAALESALERAISDHAWRIQTGQRARQRIVSHYSAFRYANQWRELYAELLA